MHELNSERIAEPSRGQPSDQPEQSTRVSPRVSLDGMRIVAVGGLGTLAAGFALAAARAGAQIILADLIPADPEVSGEVAGDSRRTNVHPALPRATAVSATFAAAGVPKPRIFGVDVTDASDLATFFDAVASPAAGDRSPIDVAIDFAGVHHKPFDLCSVDGGPDAMEALAADFRRVVEVNLTGAFLFTAAAARVMVPHRSGQIIHLCSNGSRASLYGSYAYNASKHGVEGLVKTAAAQLAAYGVRVNGVAPGTVVTELNRALLFDESGNPRSRAKSILAHTPTKRFATVEGVAQTILSMCVPQQHATGNVIFCDDGYNIEGHSWPQGNDALYAGAEALDALYEGIDSLRRSD